MTRRWEYRLHSWTGDVEFETMLNAWGEQGWRLLPMELVDPADGKHFVFERELPAQTSISPLEKIALQFFTDYGDKIFVRTGDIGHVQLIGPEHQAVKNPQLLTITNDTWAQLLAKRLVQTVPGDRHVWMATDTGRAAAL
jgi:hypothetical protein